MNETIRDTEIVDCSLNPHEFLEVKFFLISIVGSIIGLLGLFGNASTALILTRPSMRNPNNLFLTALAVFDSCLIITAFCIYAMEYIIEYTRAFNLYVAWLTYLRVTGRNELKEKSREATLVLMHNHHVFYTFSREAINFLAIINSSINFVIYLIFGKDFRKELIVVYGCGVRGITMKLPVHDKFSLWRNWTIKKRAAVRKSIGVTARDWRHKFSLSSNLDRSQADSLENARFLSNDPSLYAGGKSCQFSQSPIKALQQQSDQVEKIHEAYAQANGNHHTTSPRPVFIRRAPTYALYSQNEHLLTNGTNGSSSIFPSNFTENGTII
ncbi:hypothetical protein WR25_24707 [Diploscapter pachys]|uniref:G-protein coupled receptors family 1 profile domain-containing protein n=1 Tax=Diploscapter pachys TaxID=2018661 RepID=A0A2A2L9A0_9BILA|nr:hypothetical protein WR25_24707 [Diploscapter pachys]